MGRRKRGAAGAVEGEDVPAGVDVLHPGDFLAPSSVALTVGKKDGSLHLFYTFERMGGVARTEEAPLFAGPPRLVSDTLYRTRPEK